jgi:hypothetical protein
MSLPRLKSEKTLSARNILEVFTNIEGDEGSKE